MSLKDYLMQNQAIMKEWLERRDRIIAQKIFESYCIPVDDLLKCFEDQDSMEESPKRVSQPVEESLKEYTEKELKSFNLQKLKKICKSKKLKKYSKLSKNDLVSFILGKKVCSPKEDKPKLILRKHTYFKEYFVHEETGFLIKTKKEGVVGKIEKREGTTPTIVQLNEQDLVKCKSLRLPVKKNLSSQNNT